MRILNGLPKHSLEYFKGVMALEFNRAGFKVTKCPPKPCLGYYNFDVCGDEICLD